MINLILVIFRRNVINSNNKVFYTLLLKEHFKYLKTAHSYHLVDSNKRTMEKNRSYHSTTFTLAPEWILGLGKLFGICKSAAPVCPSSTPTAIYPNIDSVGYFKLAFKSVTSSITEPIIWKAAIGAFSLVLVTVVLGSSIMKIINVMDMVHVYNQIVVDPNLVNFLNTSYPDLNAFNEQSAILIEIKSLSRLSYEQCEIIVKFCLHSKNHMIFGILIDPTNLLNI